MIAKGQTFTMAGHQWTVAYVNPSRAHCVASEARTVTITDRRGQERTFVGQHRVYTDISPNTDPALLAEVCR